MKTENIVALSIAITWWVAQASQAQMTTGSGMTDFAATFGISAKGWSVQQTACSRGANVLWPGDEASFTFFIKPGEPYKGAVRADVIRYGTKGKPGDWWKPVVFKIADTSSGTVEADAYRRLRQHPAGTRTAWAGASLVET